MEKLNERLFELFHDKNLGFLQRNEITLMFVESKDKSCIPHLIEEILKPENDYALPHYIWAVGQFDCSTMFEQLFSWAMSENPEAASQAIQILEDQQVMPTQEQFDRCMKSLDDLEDLMPDEDENGLAHVDYLKDLLNAYTEPTCSYGQTYLH